MASNAENVSILWCHHILMHTGYSGHTDGSSLHTIVGLKTFATIGYKQNIFMHLCLRISKCVKSSCFEPTKSCRHTSSSNVLNNKTVFSICLWVVRLSLIRQVTDCENAIFRDVFYLRRALKYNIIVILPTWKNDMITNIFFASLRLGLTTKCLQMYAVATDIKDKGLVVGVSRHQPVDYFDI